MGDSTRFFATQADIARRLNIDRTTVCKVLNNAPGAYVGEKTRSRILEMARRLGYDFSRLRHTHRRVTERAAARIPARVQVVLWDGSCYAAGQCSVVNLSVEGALLANLQLEPQALPLKPCYVVVEFALENGRRASPRGDANETWGGERDRRGPSEAADVRPAANGGSASRRGAAGSSRRLRVRAEIVRFHAAEFVELAVQFVDLTDPAREGIEAFIEQGAAGGGAARREKALASR